MSPTVVLIWASATLIRLVYRAWRLRADRFGVPVIANLRIESRAMAARKRTPAEAGALAASLLVEACGTDPENSLRLRVVRDLALDLGRRLEVLATEDAPDALVEAALA